MVYSSTQDPQKKILNQTLGWGGGGGKITQLGQVAPHLLNE